MTVLLDIDLDHALRDAGHPLSPPWWTNRALMTGPGREAVMAAHRSSLDAGARVLTAATFHAGRPQLETLGLDPGAGTAWMVHAATGVAQAAAKGRDVTVAGALGPVPDAAGRSDDELRATHGWLATELVRGRVRTVLVERIGTAREARLAVEAIRRVGGTPWVVYPMAGPTTLESGEDVGEAAVASGADLVAVGGPLQYAGPALARLRQRWSGPTGAVPDLDPGETPECFAAVAAGWSGAALLGARRNATPAHLAALGAHAPV